MGMAHFVNTTLCWIVYELDVCKSSAVSAGLDGAQLSILCSLEKFDSAKTADWLRRRLIDRTHGGAPYSAESTLGSTKYGWIH